MPCDLKEIANAGEAAFAGETRRDLFGRDRDDGIDFDLAFFEAVSPAGTNARTHPDANASRDRTTSHAIAQIFREQHPASLPRDFPLAEAETPTRLRHQSHFEMRNRSPCPKKTTIAHPRVSQFSGTRGCRTNAAAASPMATIGANRATPRETSVIIPISGILLISNGEKRIKRKRSQTAAQIARQDIAAVRNDALTISQV